MLMTPQEAASLHSYCITVSRNIDSGSVDAPGFLVAFVQQTHLLEQSPYIPYQDVANKS